MDKRKTQSKRTLSKKFSLKVASAIRSLFLQNSSKVANHLCSHQTYTDTT